jgi:hypothetical protein
MSTSQMMKHLCDTHDYTTKKATHPCKHLPYYLLVAAQSLHLIVFNLLEQQNI